MKLDEHMVRRAITEAFPSLDTSDAHYFAAGWDYELWQIDGDLLVRFPLRDECGPPLQVEARLLTELADAVSVPIPRPVHVSDGVDAFPMPFFAYRKLPGVALEQAKLDDAGRDAVARQIGAFLSELHRFPIARAAALGVPVKDGAAWRDGYRRMQIRAREEVLPRLSAESAQGVEAFFEEFLSNDAHFAFTPRLIHGDLDAAHVLVNAAGTSVTGVIDFGDARVGDPAGDFGGYPEFKEEMFNMPLREAILSAYELPLDETFRERAAIYRDRISPFHAVLYGLEAGNEAWLRRGLAAIDRWAAAVGW
jgi:aminoglycoside 2''-phosphotransferase